MNKYLMMSAAAALAAASRADAKTATLCDENNQPMFTVNYVHDIYTVQYSGSDGGLGIGERTKGLGKHVPISDNYFCATDALCSWALSYDISLPLKDGGTWTTLIKFSGTSAFIGNSGNYKLCNAAPSNSNTGMRARTKALIDRIRAKRRAANGQ